MRDIRVLALLALAACAHGSSASPSSTSAPSETETANARTNTQGALDFATKPPSGPVLLVRGAPSQAISDALSKACRRAGLDVDPRLGQLAMAVAEQSQGGRQAPRGSFVGHMGHQLGLIEPTPQLWLAGASRADMLVSGIAPAVQEAAHSMKLSHCGGALLQDEQMSVLAVAFSGRFLSLKEPLPRRVAAGTALTLEAKLDKGYARPALAITDPQGVDTRVPLPDERNLRHVISLDREGRHSIEILAEGPGGISVIAVIPVMVGDGPAPAAPEYEEGEAESDVDSFVARLSELIAETRAARNLPQLKVDRRLVRIAQAHSEDMNAHQFVAHASKTTGDATQRLTKAGLKAQVLLENIGRGYSASEIHEGLMASPGHRANILHPDAREMGLGVVIQPEGERIAFLVTELFAKLIN